SGRLPDWRDRGPPVRQPAGTGGRARTRWPPRPHIVSRDARAPRTGYVPPRLQLHRDDRCLLAARPAHLDVQRLRRTGGAAPAKHCPSSFTSVKASGWATSEKFVYARRSISMVASKTRSSTTSLTRSSIERVRPSAPSIVDARAAFWIAPSSRVAA